MGKILSTATRHMNVRPFEQLGTCRQSTVGPGDVVEMISHNIANKAL